MSYTVFMTMEIMTFALDTLIIILAVWILFKLKGYGGLIGESLTKVGYGIVILGISQILETVDPSFLRIDESVLEMTHHLVFLLGLTLLALGFKRLMEGK